MSASTGSESTSTGTAGPGAERVALVTGAASGIGLAITERLRTDGWRVVAVDLAPEPAPDSVAADLTTREGNRLAVEQTLSRYGRLDAVVANAGFQHVSPVADFPEDRWDALLAILLTSPFLLAKYAWQPLCASPGGGRFLVVASAHALVASPHKAGYVAAKHGVLGLVKTLALEGAPHGLSVSALCPAFVRTPLVERQVVDRARENGVSQEEALRDIVLAPHVLKRLLEPAEVADAAAFLLGPSGAAFTGAAVPMDCGWTAR